MGRGHRAQGAARSQERANNTGCASASKSLATPCRGAVAPARSRGLAAYGDFALGIGPARERGRSRRAGCGRRAKPTGAGTKTATPCFKSPGRCAPASKQARKRTNLARADRNERDAITPCRLGRASARCDGPQRALAMGLSGPVAGAAQGSATRLRSAVSAARPAVEPRPQAGTSFGWRAHERHLSAHPSRRGLKARLDQAPRRVRGWPDGAGSADR